MRPSFFLFSFVCHRIVQILTSENTNKIVNTYPWNGMKTSDRQNDLLDSMRESLSLSIKDELLPKELFLNGSIEMKNIEGQKFSLYIQSKREKKKHRGLPYPILDESIIDDHLRGQCSIHASNYWDFEWCHRSEIRQFHRDFVKGQYIRNPDWSLGVYERTAVIRERGDFTNVSASIVKMIDFFTGGQHCDENNKLRSTEVHFLCCDAKKAYASDTLPPITIQGITEPTLCYYQMVVCVPAMCFPVYDNETKIKPKKTKSLTSIMNTLNTTCLLRQDGWWTYELCYGSGVRQFRLETTTQSATQNDKTKQGVLVQRQSIEAQFSLGLPQLNQYLDIEYLLSSAGIRSDNDNNDEMLSVHDKKDMKLPIAGLYSDVLNTAIGPKSLKFEFINGTMCDIEHMSRATTVQVFCGPKDAITDIIEDRTCHYQVKATSQLLCSHPAFKPQEVKIANVIFEPEEEDD